MSVIPAPIITVNISLPLCTVAVYYKQYFLVLNLNLAIPGANTLYKKGKKKIFFS